jgi:putative SOS response-associated peptidase YedK
MCGRYTLFETKGLGKRFNLAKKPMLHATDNYNVSPGQFMPIVTRGDDGNEASLMKWGLIPHWAKDIKIGYKLINARRESLFEKPMWKAAVLHTRCLVPARGFYEWKQSDAKTKQPFYIHPKDQDLFAFAGLWSTWKDVEGKELRSFTIVTTTPNKEMASVHTRMPVILTPDEENHWLDPTVSDPDLLESLLAPYANGKLEIYPVSPDVNTPRNNHKRLIYHLDD